MNYFCAKLINSPSHTLDNVRITFQTRLEREQMEWNYYSIYFIKHNKTIFTYFNFLLLNQQEENLPYG